MKLSRSEMGCSGLPTLYFPSSDTELGNAWPSSPVSLFPLACILSLARCFFSSSSVWSLRKVGRKCSRLLLGYRVSPSPTGILWMVLWVSKCLLGSRSPPTSTNLGALQVIFFQPPLTTVPLASSEEDWERGLLTVLALFNNYQTLATGVITMLGARLSSWGFWPVHGVQGDNSFFRG